MTHPRIDFTGKIRFRLRDENRLLIFPEQFSIAIVIAIAVLKSEPVWKIHSFEIITTRYIASVAFICPIPSEIRQLRIRQDRQATTGRNGGDHFLPFFLQSGKKQFIIGFPDRNSDKPISSKNENLR
jgi:hypothetical protein